ncbi:MAG: GNAT family N-acetyltransferase [Candidatus Undinarchaeales archaeon]
MEFEVKLVSPEKKYLDACFRDVKKRLKEYLGANYWFLAYKENKIVGFIAVRETDDFREMEAYSLPIDFSPGEFEPFIYVEMAYVSKKFLKKGAWSSLRNKLDEVADENKINVITEIANNNSFLIKKLKEKGYKKIAKSRDFNYLFKKNK